MIYLIASLVICNTILLYRQLILEKNNKKFKEITEKLIETSEKTLNLIKEDEENIKVSFRNVSSDLDNLYDWNKEQNKSLVQIMDKHNRLADVTYQQFKELFCDLHDNQCNSCPFYDICTKQELDLEEDSIHDSDTIEIDDSNEYHLRLNESRDYKDLEKRMKDSNIPTSTIEDYITQIKSLANSGLVDEDEEIKIVWGIKNHQGYIITEVPGKVGFGQPFSSKKSKSKTRKPQIKLVDPNSKIVKSLEKIFKNK
ncbi:MAG: hypothetical protein IJH34_05960 [Romboutsia sp.]|nr:hypothetical protein [Romboutsia sp.]